MKKITSKNLSKRLAQYGAMSAAVMAGADANGQVVYTDVDPDVTLQVGDAFSLDFEGDTFEDLSINNPDGLAGGTLQLYSQARVVHWPDLLLADMSTHFSWLKAMLLTQQQATPQLEIVVI